MHHNLNPRMLGLFIFIIFSWGLSWPINKVGLVYMSPLWYTAIRLIIGTFTMMLVVISAKQFALPNWRDLPLIFTIGLLQISVYILLTNLGLDYLPAGRSSLLAYTTPLWIMPMAILFFKEESNRMRWIGFSLGFGGLLLLLSPWEMNWKDPNVLFGGAMLLLASLGWAISIMCARYMQWNKSPMQLVPWQLLVGSLPIVLYALIKEPIFVTSWNPSLVMSLLYTGILVTGLSYWSGVVINKELPTIMVSIGFLIVPVFSILISAVFMNEHIGLTTGSAMLLIFSGLICVVV